MVAPMPHRQLLAAIAFVALLAACVARPVAPSLTPAPSPTLNPNQLEASARLLSGPPSFAPTPVAQPPSPTPSPSGAPSTPRPTPTLPPPSDPVLYGRLPAEIRGVPVWRGVVPATRLDTGGDTCAYVCPGESSAIARALGVTVDVMSVGIAMEEAAFDNDPKTVPQLAVWVVAFRVPGVAGQRIIDARVAAVGPLIEPQELRGGGKPVTRVWTDVMRAQYLYASGDVLYVLYGADFAPPNDMNAWDPKGAVPSDVVAALEALP